LFKRRKTGWGSVEKNSGLWPNPEDQVDKGGLCSPRGRKKSSNKGKARKSSRAKEEKNLLQREVNATQQEGRGVSLQNLEKGGLWRLL